MSGEPNSQEHGVTRVEEAQQPTSAVAETESVDLDWIMAELREGFDYLPEEAIEAARQAPRLVVPVLIEELRRAIKDAREGRDFDGNSHQYALFLLCEFRAREALPAVLEAVSLPDLALYELFDDVLTEYLARVIITLAEDPLTVLEALIANRGLNEFVRWEGVQGYRYLVRDGRLSRAEAVERMRGHLRRAIDAQDRDMVGALLSELSYYEPFEAEAEIREAFDKRLFDETMVAKRNFGRVFDPSADRTIPPAVDFEDLSPTEINDSVEELDDWVWFDESADEYDDYDEDEYEQDDAWDTHAPLSTLGDGFGGRRADSEPLVYEEPPPTERLASGPRIGRNERCPCGSGKKFKKCCGARH